ncbi:RNA-directed DNA polymerase, eukaryota, reverse transcriptase zinc-binding domain protein [Tanacetum coccineum]
MGDRRSNEDGAHNISTSIFVTNLPDQTNAKVCNQYGNVIDAFIPNRRSKMGWLNDLLDRFETLFETFAQQRVAALQQQLDAFHVENTRMTNAYFEAISKKEHNISEKADTTLSLSSEEVSPVVERPINASKDTILSSALNDAPLEVVFAGRDDEESTSGKTIVDESVGIEQNEPVYFNVGKSLNLVVAANDVDNNGFSVMDHQWQGDLFATGGAAQVDTSNHNRSQPVNTFEWGSGEVRCNLGEPNILATYGNDMGITNYGLRLKDEAIKKLKERTQMSKKLLVLDDTCFYESDLTLSLVGKLKEFGSLPNLKKILEEEGFTDIIIRYMGGWAPNFTDDDASDDASNEESADSKFDNFQKEVNLEKESESAEIPETLFEEPEHVEMKSSAFKEVHKEDSKDEKSEDPSKVNSHLDQVDEFSSKGADSTASYKENVNTSGCSGNFKSVSTLKTGGAMLHLIEDLIKVGQAIGYKMEGCMNDIEEIVKSQGDHEWKGDVTVMSDFNEVRSEDERYGSIFNSRGADAFNSFISTGGLVEVPSGGYSFTWSHKSASKMSRLDRFLVSEDLMRSCSNLSSLILDRYLSDHRPILLRELSLDYGPTPFRFFHNWFDFEGFEAFITDTWRSINIIEPNAMLKMEKKLKLLKGHIRVWVKGKQFSALNLKNDLKNKLSAIGSSIDKGKTSSVSLEERMAIMNNLISLEKIDSSELAQKANVKWSIEGDENSKFFHGIINKRQNNLAIRGIIATPRKFHAPFGGVTIIVDGEWIDDTMSSKTNFFSLPSDLILPYADALFSSLDFPNDYLWIKSRPGKVLTVIDGIVNEVQSAFIANRQILDGPFILNEIIHWCKAKKKQTMIFKVDFEKAFDSVRTQENGLVNGSPTSEFQFFKGLKQGDPLSPFLFILAMESLHLSFQNVVNAGLFKGVDLDSSLQLSHLFYADDVVFLGQWCDSNISTIIRVLDCFFRASGLRINLHKSKLMGIAVENSLVDFAANNIGCMTLNVPFSYLGVNIGGHMSRIKSWDVVINKIHSRLSKWKMKVLSIGDTIHSHFFNGVDPNVRKMTFVKWDNVLASKEKGGLGVLSFYALNCALIFKWIWRFVSSSFPSNWIDIMCMLPSLYDKGIDLLGAIKKKVGNGENTLFWQEPWKGDAPLKNVFPRLYALESDKGITVAKKMTHPSLGTSFRRNPRGGIEQVQMVTLLSQLEGLTLPNMLDRWSWSHSGDGEFSVSSTRNLIDDKTLATVSSKTQWCKYVLLKVNIFSWRVKLNNLPTRLNLSRRGMDLNSIFCSSCNLAVESTQHIFFICPMMKDLYKKIARWWDVNMVELASYEDWWCWLSSLRLSSKLKMLLEETSTSTRLPFLISFQPENNKIIYHLICAHLPKVQFLGHVIDSEGIYVDPAKIDSIKDWKVTQEDVPTEIWSISSVKLNWGEKEETAFQTLKQKLCSAPILALPEGSENFVILNAQVEARKEENYGTEDLYGMIKNLEPRADRNAVFEE